MRSRAISNEERNTAKEIVIRYKLYDVISVCFFMLGLVMLFMFYNRISERGNLSAFIESPTLLFIIISPFIPAAFFSHLSKKKREQLEEMAYGSRGEENKSSRTPPKS